MNSEQPLVVHLCYELFQMIDICRTSFYYHFFVNHNDLIVFVLLERLNLKMFDCKAKEERDSEGHFLFLL